MMLELSVLIPLRDASEAAHRLVSDLDAVLRRWGRSFEILIIDDASQSETARIVERLLQHCPYVRLLQLDRPSGLSAALTAGMTAARGDVVVTIEASLQYSPQQIPLLVERLSRADLVCGRRQRGRLAKLVLALMQVPRRLLLGLELRDPDCLFWAARREALAGLELPAGMHRFLGSLVTSRGYRVAEIHVEHQPVARRWSFAQSRPSLGNLLAAWWHRRGWQTFAVVEVGATTVTESRIGPPQGAGPALASMPARPLLSPSQADRAAA